MPKSKKTNTKEEVKEEEVSEEEENVETNDDSEEENSTEEETEAEEESTEKSKKNDTIDDTITFLSKRDKKLKNGIDKSNIDRASKIGKWKFLRTGIPSIDIKYGGLPFGTYTVVYGQPNSGKTTFILQTLGNAQRSGQRCLLAVSEGVFPEVYAKVQDVDTENLLLLRGENTTLDSAGQTIVELAENNKIDVVALDTLSMLLPEAIRKKKVNEDDMAVAARKISRFLYKLTPAIVRNKIAVIPICQVRQEIGGPTSGMDTYPGGNVVKHESCYTINMCPTAKSYIRGEGKFLKELELRSFSAVCKKSKTTFIREGVRSSDDTPFMFFGHMGLDKERTLFEHALRFNVIERSGAKYQFVTKDENNKDKEVSEIGEKNFVDMLSNDKDKYDELFNLAWDKRLDELAKRTKTSKQKIIDSVDIIG